MPQSSPRNPQSEALLELLGVPYNLDPDLQPGPPPGLVPGAHPSPPLLHLRGPSVSHSSRDMHACTNASWPGFCDSPTEKLLMCLTDQHDMFVFGFISHLFRCCLTLSCPA